MAPTELAAAETSPGSASASATTSAVAAAQPEPSRPSTPPPPEAAPPSNDSAVEAAELNRLTHSFFSSPPTTPVFDPFEDHVPIAMSSGSRQAMLATLGILLVSGLGIGGYAAYHRFVMPVPAPVGGATLSAPIPPPLSAPPPVERRLAQPLTASLSVEDPATDPASATVGPAEGAEELPAAQLEPLAEADGAAVADAAGEVSADAVERSPEVVHVLAQAAAADEAGFAELLSAASTLQRRGRIDEALATYHRALAVKPNAPQVLGKIGLVHLNAGDNRKAQEYAARAVELDPTSSEGWIVLGAALEAMGDRAGAIVAYGKCAEVGTGSYVVECRRLRR